jgi:virginiamycin B lyase
MSAMVEMARQCLRMEAVMSRNSATSRFLRVAPLVLAALMWCGSGLAQVVEQFPIAGNPSSIVLGPDGAMWFTQDGYVLGRIDMSGAVTRLPLPVPAHGVALGPDGNLWISEVWSCLEGGDCGYIGRLTPSGTVTLFSIPGAYALTSGPDGNVWFGNSRIGRITPSGVITEFVPPTASWVRDITAGPDGNIWYTQPNANKVCRITPSGVVTEFHVSGGTPYGIASGPDGNVWFTEHFSPRIGRITSTGAITEFPISGGSYGIVAGIDGNLWAVGPGTLRRITPNGSVTEFPIPIIGDGWYEGDPSAIAAAPDGSIWIANDETSQIVRFSLGTTVCVADATTLCLNNGRFRVTADWRTRDGSNGQGRGVALTSDSGYFWFFEAANVELVVKVLNGCGLNSRYWTFAAGLTDVEVTLTVTDTLTGAVKTYANPQGTAFQPIQDTAAFAACP